MAGFRAIDELYGSSAHRLNEACLFSFFAEDPKATVELIDRIGKDVDPEVWRIPGNFETLRESFQKAKNADAGARQRGGADKR